MSCRAAWRVQEPNARWGRSLKLSLPYDAPDGTYLPGTYYDVRFEGCIFYCRTDKLRPISDPDADVTEWQTETVTVCARYLRHPVRLLVILSRFAREADRYVLVFAPPAPVDHRTTRTPPTRATTPPSPVLALSVARYRLEDLYRSPGRRGL
jgi:hypothetical protein